MDIKKNIEIISSGVAQLLPLTDLEKKLKKKEKLIVKFGADPTAPDLHLGHAVVLSKLRQFQDLGHDIRFLIGDFTAQIGDPTGKSKTRPPLTQEKIKENTKTYFEQVSKILDPEKMTVCYNASWLEKLTANDLIKVCSKLTLARIIEREDFSSRIEKKQSISLHEILYPVFQAYDSVELEADVELGGTDQTFNLLLARSLQEQYGQEPQVVLTMPILEGLDGVQKMSKSLGNAISLAEKAETAFAKLMSISDTLMWRYFELLLLYLPDKIADLKKQVASSALHPMELKKRMAFEVIERFWTEKEAKSAKQAFEAVFQKKDYSKIKSVKLPENVQNPLWVVELLKILGAISTSSEAKRLIQAGAVSIDEQVVKDFKFMVDCRSDMIIKVGKHRIYRIS